MAYPKIKFTYFAIPGLGEASRLILTIAGIPFEDVRIQFSDWPTLKPTTPFGSLPVAEIDGKVLAQSGALERYFARLGGLSPEDSLDLALADQTVFLVKDIADALSPTARISDVEEKLKARKKIVDEVFPVRFKQLTGLLTSNGGEYFAGKALSYADITVYVYLSNMISGNYDGIPKTLLDDYPELKAFRNKIASIPTIKAYFEKETNSDAVRLAFRPDQ